MERLFLKFYEGEESLAQTFAEDLPDNRISMTQLQGHCLLYKDRPLDCVKNIPTLLETVKGMEEKHRLAEEEKLKRKQSVSASN